MDADELPAVRAVRAAVAGAATPEAVGAGALEAVGDMLGWLVGALWLPADGGSLRAVATWRARVHKSRTFEARTRETTLAPGRGLPGRVWAARRIVWLEDVTRDPNFPRLAAALEEGLHGGVAFPVADGERLLGVMEFFTDRPLGPQPALEAVLQQVAREVGAGLARRAAATGPA